MCNILITPYRDGARYGLHGDYMHAVLQSGGLPFVVPHTADTALLDQYLDGADGLVLSGGGDVNPSFYGEEKSPLCGDGSILRDETELYLCRKALEKGLPVLGICRGVQVMNVALGGTLHQHVSHAENHDRDDLPADAVHEVAVVPGTRLHAIFGKETLGVNSRHHQAVKDAGNGLVISAVAEDGTIEAVERPGDAFFLGVQWHPESMYEKYDDMKKIFAAFVAAVKGNK